jgi:leucyl aminopeptidase (aminopeptidase T)
VDNINKAAKIVVTDCMGVKPGEKVVVVADTSLHHLGQVLFEAAVNAEAEAQLLIMIPRESNGQEPPTPVAAALLEADVGLLVTSKSLSHTKARKEANNKGARIASLPGLTSQVMARTLNSGYEAIAAKCMFYAEKLSQGQKVNITTDLGTNLTFSIAGRPGIADTGLLREPGMFGNLPAGEAYIAPVEGTAHGTLVIDGSMAAIGLIGEPITIKVENGLAVQISGGKEAQKLNQLMEKHGAKARNIAELGIGLNPEAMLTGVVIEDEKVEGTIHIALGDNSTFGGTVEVDSHLDGVIKNPTVTVDGEIIIARGKPVLP